MSILNFFKTKAKDNSFIPAITSLPSIFNGLFFGRNNNYIDKYNGWVYLCTRLISDEVASAKLRLYQKGAGGDDKELTNHPLLDLLHKPNQTITGQELLKHISSNIDLDGNAYIYRAVSGGKTIELWPMRPDWTKIVPSEDKVDLIKNYLYLTDGVRKSVALDPNEVIHFRDFNPKFFNTKEPYKGMGVVEATIRTIEEDEMIKEWNKKFFINGAVPQAVFEYDGVMTPEQRSKIESLWKQNYSGVDNSHKTPFLQGGLKYKKTGLSQKELDFIEQRKLDRDDIFSMFGVPKGLLLSDNVNLANAKMALWSFTRFTVRPRLKLIESFLNSSLAKEYGNLYFEYDNPVPDDREITVAEYEKGCGKWLTPNDIRREEGLPELEGGDTLNFQTSPAVPPVKKVKSKAKKEEEIDERTQRGEKAWSEMIKIQKPYEDKYQAELKKYFFGLRERVIKKLGQKSFLKKEELNLLDEKGEAKIIFDILTPLQREYFEKEARRALKEIGLENDFDFNEELETSLKEYDLNLSEDITKTTSDDLANILKGARATGMSITEITERMSDYFDSSEKYRAERIARSETIRTSNNALQEAWIQSGVVEKKEWYTAMDERTCPYCKQMDGKIIDLKDSFFKKGDTFIDLKLDYREIKEPPLHANCRCVLLPVL